MWITRDLHIAEVVKNFSELSILGTEPSYTPEEVNDVSTP